MVVPVSMSTAFQAAKEIASDLGDVGDVDEDDIRRVQIHSILILCQSSLSRFLKSSHARTVCRREPHVIE